MMRYRLTELISCPNCKNSLGCIGFKEEGSEIIDGILTCSSCGRWYPIIDGIPRLLQDWLEHCSKSREFIKKYEDKIPDTSINSSKDSFTGLQKKTSKSFGFEWNVFDKMFKEYEMNFLSYISPIEKSFFKNKLVLDAGCGMGRHTYFAAKYGAEVVAIDLSDAVEPTYKNTKVFSKVHVVQADMYHLPFRKELFDYIVCIGVLTIIPDPEKAIASLVELMKPETLISIWTPPPRPIYEPIRMITAHIPHGILYYLCYLPAIIVEVSNQLYILLSKSKFTRNAADLLPFRVYLYFPFKVKLNDCFDVFSAPHKNQITEKELKYWLERAQLKCIKIIHREIHSIKKGINAIGMR